MQHNFAGYEKHKHPALVPLPIGKYKVWLGAGQYIEDVSHVDVVVSLNGNLPDVPFGYRFEIIQAGLRDYGGVPPEWPDFIKNVASEIRKGKRYMGYCVGGHGRTGTFAASLVAVLTPKIVDPVQYVRANYCERAVESYKQIEAVFALTGRPVPDYYPPPPPPPKIPVGKDSKFPRMLPWADSWDDDEAFLKHYGPTQASLDEDELNAALMEMLTTGDTSKLDALELKAKRST